MKTRYFLAIFVAVLLVVSLFLGIESYLKENTKPVFSDVFVGVDAAYSGVGDIEKLVEEVKSYTNFFVIGSTQITNDVTNLSDVCQYIYNSGLYFAPFMHITTLFNQSQWTSYARQRWGSRFWGVYAYDEAGGNQIDRTRFQVGNISLMLVPEADNYTDAAKKYVEILNQDLTEFRFGDFPLMTSDYALYELDYWGGYDVVLAQFGWNFSRPLQIALCRGAATMRNKDWGVIITWTYTQPPYLEDGEQLYEDMVLAYQNGAKYILVFDYPNNGPYGILQKDQLDALKQFWQYVKNNPRTSDTTNDRVAYVLPKDYGYGFRGPNDTIWGLWSADKLSYKIWSDASTLVEQYKPKMDIIYEDDLQFSAFNYSKLMFWNGTVHGQ